MPTSESPLVLAEHADFLVLDKPSGMSVHNQEPSLQNSLRSRFPQLHFVNRLDLETSGIVLATTSASAVAELTSSLQDASSRKIYRAIVKRPRDEAAFLRQQKAESKTWMWEDSITDKAEGRKNPRGKAGDRVVAQTQAQLLAGDEYFWDLQLQIMTGRQHQIRKHCAIHEVPIVGDGRYGREALNQKTIEVHGVGRMMLHAWKLEFLWRQKSVQFTASLPLEFAKLLSNGALS